MNTIAQCLKWVYQQFDANDLYYGHGTNNAWDEAVHLILAAMDLAADSDQSVLNLPVSTEQSTIIKKWTQLRIEKRIPLPYLTHQAWFMQLPFYVDERVIIPRSPFGEWLECQFRPWVQNPEKIRKILDIGTGSGCIAIAAGIQFPHAMVDAIDIDADALAVAKKNCMTYGLENRVHLQQSDGFSQLSGQQYDLIIANPPYVSETEMKELPQEFYYEPMIALSAGADGLDVVKRLLADAGHHLKDDGILAVEVGNSDEILQQAFPNVPFIWLEQSSGGEGLFLMTKAEWLKYQHELQHPKV